MPNKPAVTQKATGVDVPAISEYELGLMTPDPEP
jgi:hypothetical protein